MASGVAATLGATIAIVVITGYAIAVASLIGRPAWSVMVKLTVLGPAAVSWPEPLDQVYRRIGEQLYRYEAVASGFTADLTVNAAGFVTRYGDIWEAQALSE